jgi:hypothetical protein
LSQGANIQGDSYLYGDTSVLRNLAEIRDANRLSKFESDHFFASCRQLNLVHPGFLLRVGIWLCGSDRRRDSIDVQPNDKPS